MSQDLAVGFVLGGTIFAAAGLAIGMARRRELTQQARALADQWHDTVLCAQRKLDAHLRMIATLGLSAPLIEEGPDDFEGAMFPQSYCGDPEQLAAIMGDLPAGANPVEDVRGGV